MSNSSPQTPAKLLRHVVLFGFKTDTSPDQLRDIERAFCSLPEQINEIYDFEWGTNVSPENLAQGYTHCFLVTFQSEAERDVYLPHAGHQSFVELLQPYVEQVLVVDYWAK